MIATVEYIVRSIWGTKQLVANPNAWFLCYVTKRGGPTKSACFILFIADGNAKLDIWWL